MQIKEFIEKYNNHPVLFIGTGLSLRYLKNSYSWDNLLKQIILDTTGNEEDYLILNLAIRKMDITNILKLPKKLKIFLIGV